MVYNLTMTEGAPAEEKKSSIAKIIDRTKDYPGVGDFFREEMEDKFQKVEKLGIEREKTDFEKKFIETTLRYLPDFLRRYGQKDYLPLREDHVCLVDESLFADQFNKFSEEIKEVVGFGEVAAVGGLWLADFQRVIVFSQYPDDLRKLPMIFHEMMHAESFDSREVVDLDQTQKVKKEQSRAVLDTKNLRELMLAFRPRRFGLSVLGIKDDKFGVKAI